MNRIPYEIILKILTYCDLETFHNLSRCNKYIRCIYLENMEKLYRIKLKVDFKKPYKNNRSWKTAYIQHYKWERIKSLILKSHWGYRYLRYFSKNRDMDKDILNYIYDDSQLFSYNIYRMRYIDCYTREFVIEFSDKIMSNTEKTFFENFYIRSTRIPREVIQSLREMHSDNLFEWTRL